MKGGERYVHPEEKEGGNGRLQPEEQEGSQGGWTMGMKRLYTKEEEKEKEEKKYILREI